MVFERLIVRAGDGIYIFAMGQKKQSVVYVLCVAALFNLLFVFFTGAGFAIFG